MSGYIAQNNEWKKWMNADFRKTGHLEGRLKMRLEDRHNIEMAIRIIVRIWTGLKWFMISPTEGSGVSSIELSGFNTV